MGSQAVVVSLAPEAVAALRELAHREYRNPQGQAAWLVLEGLKQRGALPTEPAAAVLPTTGGPDAAAPE